MFSVSQETGLGLTDPMKVKILSYCMFTKFRVWNDDAIWAPNYHSSSYVPFFIFQITVFRNFFVNLNVPLKVTRGEIVVIQAIVFNYFKTDLSVS